MSVDPTPNPQLSLAGTDPAAPPPQEPLLRVSSLHALAYCERLFYLEDVEELRVSDAAVLEGRRLHEQVEDGPIARGLRKPALYPSTSMSLEAPTLGLCGRIDALREADGALIPIEVKKGKSAPAQPDDGTAAAWRGDQLQVAAYAMILEETQGVAITEGRVRYLEDGRTIRVRIDDPLRAAVHRAITRARALRQSLTRPPVTNNERLCPRCSAVPVCLPEEERLARDEAHRPVRLYPPHMDRLVVHVIEPGAHVGRKGDQLTVKMKEAGDATYPIRQVGAVVVHGYAQISSQAIRLCTDHEVAVQWMTSSGLILGTLAPGAQSAQRHLRQFQALQDPEFRLHLARILVTAKVDAQLQFLLRGSRGGERPQEMEMAIQRVRDALRAVEQVDSPEQLLGREGEAAAAYFDGLGQLAQPADERLRFIRRSRRPSADRFNTLLNYGYGMLYRECLGAITAVGLHSGMGFYHRPRSSAPPLVLDMMELFRVPLVDMALVGAINRNTFDAETDFEERGDHILLSQEGRQKAIELFERRKQVEWRHSVVDYSLSYARMIELEVRLLEKEMSGEGRLFARFRLR